MTPSTRSRRGEIHTNTNLGTHAESICVFDDQLQLAYILDDGNNVAAQLRGECDEFDVLLFFESVANNQTIW